MTKNTSSMLFLKKRSGKNGLEKLVFTNNSFEVNADFFVFQTFFLYENFTSNEYAILFAHKMEIGSAIK